VRVAASSRRAAIVEATLRLIGERGADAVTHRAVAAEAGVPLASTTYYFGSKDELVREAFELAIDRSLALVEAHAVRADGPVVDRLVALAEAQLADTSAPLAAQFELMLEAGRRPQLQDLAARWDERYRAAVTTLVGEAVDVDVALCVMEGALINQVAFPVEGFADGLLRRVLTRVVEVPGTEKDIAPLPPV
jgi:TetR/AcrR family transcriptional regulator, regulator of biofilm formation and stress response